MVAQVLACKREGQFALLAAVLILWALLLRLATLGDAPILDPLEAREFQLAGILLDQGAAAWAAALGPEDMPSIAASPLVALSGAVFGLDSLFGLRLPGLILLLIAAVNAFVLGARLTCRVDASFAMAAVLFCAPGMGLVTLSATSDALALVAFTVILKGLVQILRLHGDSWVPNDWVDLDTLENKIIVTGETNHAADRRAARQFWLALGWGGWAAGAAAAVLGLVGLLASAFILWRGRVALNRDRPFLRVHPDRPEWYLGPLSPVWILPALALLLAPQFLAMTVGGDWTLAHLGALLAPRAELGAYPAAPLGWWQSPVLAGFGLAMLAPFFLASRLRGASGLESVALLACVVPAPLLLLIGWPLAALLMLLGAALAAGCLVNLHVERQLRRHGDIRGSFGRRSVWLFALLIFSAGYGGALWGLYGACCRPPWSLDDGVLTAGALIVLACLLPLALFTLIDRVLPALLAAALMLGLGVETVASRLLLPQSGPVWPDWRLVMAIDPWRSCGAGTVLDETGFSPGLRHHAAPAARLGPGDAGGDGQGIAIRIRAEPSPPPGDWREIGWIGYLDRDGAPRRAHLFANAAFGDAGWRRCLARVPPPL